VQSVELLIGEYLGAPTWLARDFLHSLHISGSSSNEREATLEVGDVLHELRVSQVTVQGKQLNIASLIRAVFYGFFGRCN
jgi:hypothetical protein